MIRWLMAWIESFRMDTRPTHQRYPETLHWERGDEFRFDLDWVSLISLTHDGFAYVQDIVSRHKKKYPVSYLAGHNLSLRDRQIDQSILDTHEYMELLRQFHISYEELQERDKKLKLVG